MNIAKSFLAPVMLLFCVSLSAQSSWPLTMVYEDMKIQIFKPETESFDNNKMSIRSAIMITEGENNVFGSMWADANLQINNSNRTVKISSAVIDELRFPEGYEASKESGMIKVIERNLTGVTIKMDDILSDLDKSKNEGQMASSMDNTPPVIYYSSNPAILVTIDGEPIIQPTDHKDIEMVVNSAFLILKYKNVFYLSNGSLWYESKSPLAGWAPKKSVPNTVSKAAKELKSDDEDVIEENGFYPEIIISTEAAELIQTDGAPTFAAIPNTSMLYITNTEDEIIMDIKSQKYFVLLAGRWYASNKLDGTWKYIDFNDLPADFANIPEGSDKDIVLASVPNTKASQDAVRESLIPQAAAVDRRTASTEIVYDGNPQFDNIQGTNMRYAVNSSGTVLYENNTYYAVDNGVWFVAHSPNGPWVVSDVRPVQINIIPPSCPVYNVRYVNIYHSTPTVVYVGYTRGYLSSYVVGRTVVYGTGYRYRPWRGAWYYPRPCTWGFGMRYNPWNGWSVNFVYGSGWFGYSYPKYYHTHYPYYAYRPQYRYRSGWWGPPVYRPPYCVPYTHYYGRQTAQVRSSSRYTVRPNPVRVSSSRNNNIYAYNSGRTGVQSTRTSSVVRNSAGSVRQGVTRSYSSQARPSYNSSGSSRNPGTTSGTRNPSTRPSSSSSSRNPGTTTRPSAGSSSSRNPGATTRPSGSSGSSSSRNPSSSSSSSTRNPSTTTRPSGTNSSGTSSSRPSGSSSINSSRNPSSSSGTSSSTRPSGSSSTRNPSSSSGSSSSRNPSSSSGSNSTSRPSSSSSSSSSSSRNPSSSSSSSTSRPSSSSGPSVSRPSSSSGSANRNNSATQSSSSSSSSSRPSNSSSSSSSNPSRSSTSSSSSSPSRSGSSSSVSRSGSSNSSSSSSSSRSSNSSSSSSSRSNSSSSRNR